MCCVIVSIHVSPPFESIVIALRQNDGAAVRVTPTAAKAQLDPKIQSAIGEIRITEETDNVEVTGAARHYSAAPVWTAGLGLGVIRC